MKRLTAILMSTAVLALAAASVALAGWLGVQTEVTPLRSDVEALSSEVSGATRAARAAQSATDGIAATVASMEAEGVDSLQRQLAGMQEAIRLINGEIDSLQQQSPRPIEPDPFEATEAARLRSDMNDLELSVANLCQEVTGSRFC